LYVGVTGRLYARVTGQNYTPELQADDAVLRQSYRQNTAKHEDSLFLIGKNDRPTLELQVKNIRRSYRLVLLLYAGVTGEKHTPELQARGRKTYAGVIARCSVSLLITL
jgi:hypothetical protein